MSDITVPRPEARSAPVRAPAKRAAEAADATAAKPYWNPYAAGVALGLVLALTYYLMGAGLGASGAFARFVAAGEHAVAPGYVAQHPYWKTYIGEGAILKEWLVFEVLGVLVGGIVAALTANRFRVGIERGDTASDRRRLWMALAGGVIAGFGTRLARGCTSGQALSGGATLALG